MNEPDDFRISTTTLCLCIEKEAPEVKCLTGPVGQKERLFMRRHWKVYSFSIVALLVAALLVIKGDAQLKQDRSQIKDRPLQAEEVDTQKFPLVDYSAAESLGPSQREKRAAVSKKYNSRHARPITESVDGVFRSSDWDVGLPALPVSKSSAVVICEIAEAQAHISEDKTIIYSEFVVRIESVLKNDAKIPLSEGSSVSVERPGGRVRFPSGKVVSFTVSHQDMPRAGGRYVLFLTHDSPIGGVIDDTLFILTGYELRAGRVFPLDKLVPGHPIMAYKGVGETSFLKDLAAALSEA